MRFNDNSEVAYFLGHPVYTSAVEDFSDGGGGKQVVSTQKVGDVAADRDDDCHDEMRQSRQRSALPTENANLSQIF